MDEIKKAEELKTKTKPKAKAKAKAEEPKAKETKKYFFGCGNPIRVKGRFIGNVIDGRLIVEGEEDAKLVAGIIGAPLREY